MSADAEDRRLAARRAVEALRSGVPSRDAVLALGSGQSAGEDRFLKLLEEEPRRGASRGLLLGGGFGSGKSHLLEHLAHLAADRGFVVSRVVISKETPLHDPVKLLRAAVESAAMPNRASGAVAEAAGSLSTESRAYAELLLWTRGGTNPVDERFALTVSLFPRLAEHDADFAEAILRFWLGDPIGVADLRRQAKGYGEARPALAPVPAKELARQRFRFLAQLFVAAGCQGWVILFDEVELIGRYSPLQRGRSYAELARWLKPSPYDDRSPVVPVFAMTDDYDAAVLTAKDDRHRIPKRLRDKQTPEYDELASAAERGIRAIERDMVLLDPPDDAELERTYSNLKQLHGDAFGWAPPDVEGLERLGATRMRQYVRAWINEWDLKRLDPEFTPETEVVTVSARYDEDSDLET